MTECKVLIKDLKISQNGNFIVCELQHISDDALKMLKVKIEQYKDELFIPCILDILECDEE